VCCLNSVRPECHSCKVEVDGFESLRQPVKELVDKAFEPMIKFLTENPEGTQYQGVPQELRDRWYEGKLTDNETSINLRLDWAIAVDALQNHELGGINELMFDQAKFDVLDLLENGEAINGTDALLKALNGARVRGQEVEDYQIISAVMYTELKGVSEEKPEGDVREYTLFIRPYVKWVDNNPLVSGSQKAENDNPTL
jgi:hypothetical protein